MTVGDQIFRSDVFVVRIPSETLKDEFNAKLMALGEVDQLPGHPELVTLRLPTPPHADLGKAWKSVMSSLDHQAEVTPAVEVGKGSLQFPLGRISVRFVQEFDDKAIEEWAHKNGLKVESRNEYVASQVIFRPANALEDFVVDLLKSIQGDDSVFAAWMPTLSRYKR